MCVSHCHRLGTTAARRSDGFECMSKITIFRVDTCVLRCAGVLDDRKVHGVMFFEICVAFFEAIPIEENKDILLLLLNIYYH